MSGTWDRSGQGNTIPVHLGRAGHSWYSLELIISSVKMPSALVKRSRGFIGVRRTYIPLRYRYAYQAGRTAYYLGSKYGPGAVRAGRKIYRWYKKKKRFSRKYIGENPGTSNSKRHCPWNTGPTSVSTRKLYQAELTVVPRNSSAIDGINTRQRDVINVRGFKVRMEIMAATGGVRAWCFHWAVIAPKDGQDLNTDGFFRNDGDNRAVEFSTQLSSLEMNTLHINSDKYTILKHRKFYLAQATTTTNVSNSNTVNSWHYVNAWIPLARQLRFNRESSTPVSGSVYLVYWFDGANSAKGSNEIPGQVLVSTNTVCYFRETRT